MSVTATAEARRADASEVWDWRLKVYFDDDPEPGLGGQGLFLIPPVFQALGRDRLRYWQMAPAEHAAMIFLLSQLRPKVAIEVGTHLGGSLQVLSHFSERVYSLDINPEIPRRLEGWFPNVEYITGPSGETLPPLLERLGRERAELGFVLIDGDHTSEGVRRDINNLLKFRPRVPLYVILHDGFNPDCRAGMRSADWASSPYVHAFDLDYVLGNINPAPGFRNELWGGLALAILLPEERQGRFEVTGKGELTLQAAIAATRPPQRSLLRRAASKAKRMLLGRH
jgi:hypothetical protein